jgi:8-oxo-dGTP pyrophosphatase MutT (NUDIX family)
MLVVGTMFFKDKKLLIDKPRKRSTYQMIGGRVEENETPIEAAIRECHEELGEDAVFDSNLIELVMEFD